MPSIKGPEVGEPVDLRVAPAANRTIVLDQDDGLLAQMVGDMHRRGEEFVDRAVRRILGAVGSYELDTVARDDLWSSVYRNLEAVLLALREQRPLGEDELAIRRELGRRRAHQGVPIDDVMRAFRVGYTVLWEGLSEIAGELGQDYAQALLEQAGQVWMTFDQVTSAVAAAYRETVETQNLDRRRRALRFLHGLQTYPQDARTTEEAARSLGIDPQGPFTVAVYAPGHQAPPLAGDILYIDQPDRVIVVSTCSGEPSRSEVTLAGVLRRHNLHHIGVGVMRQGIAGGRQSLDDAEAAFRTAIALDAPVVMFRSDWLACLGLKHIGQLEVLVAPAVQALNNDGDLCTTLDAFLEADGSMTATGKTLFVHANTVAYRLRQFAERTGIDPRTATGMALTQLALTYSREASRTTASRTPPRRAELTLAP